MASFNPRAENLSPKALSSELMAVLAALEHEFPVCHWTVGNIPIWPLIRLRWFFHQWAQSRATSDSSYVGDGGTAASLRVMLTGAAAWVSARREDRLGEDHGAQHRDIVLLSDGLSFARIGKHWLERFCDPLIYVAEKKGLRTALWTPLHLYHRPRHSRSSWIQPALDRRTLLGALRARLAPYPADLPRVDDVCRWLVNRGLTCASVSRVKVTSDGARLIALARDYCKRLSSAKPRLAFIVSYYSLEGMAFVLACGQVGVPVVDIQHGVQGEFHPAYAAWPTRIALGRHPLIPDYFWVWSEWEQNVIREWSSGSVHRPIVGGNPWHFYWREQEGQPQFEDLIREVGALRRLAQGRPVVLVTLQFGLKLSEQLEPLAALLGLAKDRFAFWVRLHPAMLERRDEVRTLLTRSGTSFELDRSSDLPLQALLPNADIHLTHSSSAVIEAAQFGVKSVITSEYGAELFAPVLESGIVVVETGEPFALFTRIQNSLAEFPRNGVRPESNDLGHTLEILLGDKARHLEAG